MEYLKPTFNKELKQSFDKKTKKVSYSEEPVLPFKLVGKEEDHPRLIRILNRLCKSEFGYEQAKTACEAGFTLGFASTSGAIGVCDQAGSFITLNPRFSDDVLVGTLSHESRHAGQFARGGNELFGIDNIKSEIIKFRSMEADAEVSNVTACYELYQQGDTKPYLEYGKKNPYIYNAFKQAQPKDEPVTKEAQTAAFKAWYDNLDTKYSYEKGYHVDHMKKALAEEKSDKYPYSNNITSEQQINQTCVTKNGCYFTDNKNLLETGKFLEISDTSRSVFENFFIYRQQHFGLPMDETLKDIPIQRSRFLMPEIIFDAFKANDNKDIPTITVNKLKQMTNRGSR
ncbi:MAG: DUF6782 family putative metallopeptidase [Alphaproteobacteria bacterium]